MRNPVLEMDAAFILTLDVLLMDLNLRFLFVLADDKLAELEITA